jgi:superfamily II DNA or RNA helicase
LVAEYGHIVVDECHHLSAFTFEKVMREVKAQYVVGLTATPARRDGHHAIIFMQCEPIRYRMNARAMTDDSFRAHRHTSPDGLPDTGQADRDHDSGCIRRLGQRSGA